MVQLKDLSVALKNNTMDPNEVKITRLSHAESQRRMAKGISVPAELIPPFLSPVMAFRNSRPGPHKMERPSAFPNLCSGDFFMDGKSRMQISRQEE
jgi:hypothetical protein